MAHYLPHCHDESSNKSCDYRASLIILHSYLCLSTRYSRGCEGCPYRVRRLTHKCNMQFDNMTHDAQVATDNLFKKYTSVNGTVYAEQACLFGNALRHIVLATIHCFLAVRQGLPSLRPDHECFSSKERFSPGAAPKWLAGEAAQHSLLTFSSVAGWRDARWPAVQRGAHHMVEVEPRSC